MKKSLTVIQKKNNKKYIYWRRNRRTRQSFWAATTTRTKTSIIIIIIIIIIIFDYLNSKDAKKKMHWSWNRYNCISTWQHLHFICHRQDSFKLFRCWWKLHKIRKPIETGIYDAYIAKYIPGTLELVFQGILEDIDT